MTELIRQYLELEERLIAWRVDHLEDSAEEDGLLAEMDRVWWKLSSDEMKWIETRDRSSVNDSMVPPE